MGHVNLKHDTKYQSKKNRWLNLPRSKLLAALWRILGLPLSPPSPYSTMETLASVPAPLLSPVARVSTSLYNHFISSLFLLLCLHEYELNTCNNFDLVHHCRAIDNDIAHWKFSDNSAVLFSLYKRLNGRNNISIIKNMIDEGIKVR